MNRILRWLLRGVLALAGLAAAALGLVWILVAGSLPDYDAEIETAGLSAPAEVIRDANAVPHIRAASAEDAWFALGLVHAQDRLWQMEVNRRAVQGRLSAIFGPRTVALDRQSKILDLYGHAKRSLTHQSPEVQAALTAYSAGVNAWIKQIDARSLGRGAPEFFLFTEGFAPWTPADSLGILKMMALRLTGAARSEVRRARFQLALPPERVRDILPEDPGPVQTVIPRFSEIYPGARFPKVRHAQAEDPLALALGAPPVDRAGASNAWAVDASRSSQRAPLLASDPHLWLSAPSVWYLAGLSGGRLTGIGATLPGVPAIVIGHNGRIGWGLTTGNVDDQDIFIEKVSPSDPASYLTPLGWRSFETRRIRIEIDGARPLIETVRRTRHGPVLEGDMFGVDAVTPEGHVAALSWTALTDEDRSLTALHGLLGSNRVRDALSVAPLVAAPAQVVTLADAREVAMVLAGRVPLRQADNPVRGRLPSPGWKSVHDWVGDLPVEAIPSVRAPEEGAVAHANNRLTDAAYPEHIGYDWAPPYRIRRISKELSGRRFHSRDSFVALQADAVSEMARAVLPLVAQDLWWRSPVAAEDGLRGEALARLAEWNGEMDQHAPEPLIFSEWMRRLTQRLASDEIGPLIRELPGLQPLFIERVFRDIDGAGIWCDVTKTPEREGCPEIAAKALDEALGALARAHGRSLDGWRWGEEHRAVHRHMPLGFSDWLGLAVNIEHETSGGSHTLMRGLSAGSGPRPFENIHASGFRAVYDFADLDRSVWILSTGQSGHPFSRWYDHLAELWARGDMIPMSMDEEDARSGAVGVMRLTPEGG